MPVNQAYIRSRSEVTQQSLGKSQILDIFYAREHLWAYGRSYFDTEIAAKAWAEPLNSRLETDGPGPILAAMAALEAQHPGADPEEVAEHHRYFTKLHPQISQVWPQGTEETTILRLFSTATTRLIGNSPRDFRARTPPPDLTDHV